MTGRLPRPEPGDLDAEQRALYEAITGGPRARGPQAFPLTDERGRLDGPFNAMLLSPALGGALQQLGAQVRYDSRLGDRARELATLAVAGVWDSAYEQYAHERTARALGMTPQETDAARDGTPDALADGHERLVLATAHALAARGDLTGEEYAAAVAGLGESGLFELSTLVGYYATLALQLRVFRVAAPADQPR